MAQTASALATKLAAQAAGVAAAMAGGTTAAEVSGLADLMSTLGKYPTFLIPPLLLGDQTKTQVVPG
jgi:hypothetical protein